MDIPTKKKKTKKLENQKKLKKNKKSKNKKRGYFNNKRKNQNDRIIMTIVSMGLLDLRIYSTFLWTNVKLYSMSVVCGVYVLLVLIRGKNFVIYFPKTVLLLLLS